MKKFIGIGLSLVLPLLIVTSAFANGPFDFVDIGNPASEAGHLLFGWGPIEPATHGGNWGGFNTTGENTRVVWYSDHDGSQKGKWACTPDDLIPDPNGNEATLMMRNPIGKRASLKMRVLDGIGDDSFEVYVMGKKVYSYVADPSPTEVWKVHIIPLKGIVTKFLPLLLVKIVATGQQWTGWCPYGQLAVDWVKVVN